MSYIERTKIIKKGKHWWNFDEKEYIYEEVEILGKRIVGGIDGSRDWTEYLVKNKRGDRFTTSEIYN